jgi:hypothetical protein
MKVELTSAIGWVCVAYIKLNGTNNEKEDDQQVVCQHVFFVSILLSLYSEVIQKTVLLDFTTYRPKDNFDNPSNYKDR